MLAGRVALVTGASGGIGAAVVRVLRREGAWVGMVARRHAPLAAAARELDGVALPGDASDAPTAERLVAEVERQAGATPDILVNAAGAFLLAPVAATGPNEFQQLLAANLVAPFVMIRAVLPGMQAADRGDIVTIGSIAGRHAFPHNGAYSAAKFGVRGLHAVLAAELRGSGVRATLLEPAATDTALWDAIDFDRHTGLPPRSLMLQPESVADAVLFALTRAAGVAVPNLMVERS